MQIFIQEKKKKKKKKKKNKNKNKNKKKTKLAHSHQHSIQIDNNDLPCAGLIRHVRKYKEKNGGEKRVVNKKKEVIKSVFKATLSQNLVAPLEDRRWIQTLARSL